MAKKKTGKNAGGRLQHARAQMYRDLVFQSAEFVFGDKGFEHTTMQQIAAEAGISLKTLYATFAGKAELYGEIQRVRGQALLTHVGAEIEAGSDPMDRITRAVRAQAEYLFEHPDWFRMHLQDRLPWGLPPREEFARGFWREGVGRFAQIIAEGARAGIFYDDDPMALAMMIHSVMQVQIARAVHTNETDVEAVIEAVMVPLRRLVCLPGGPAQRRAAGG